MKKSVKVAGAAAASLLSFSFLLAYGATTAASAQIQSYQAPVTVAPDVATPVTPIISDNSISPAADAGAQAIVQPLAARSLAQLVDGWQQTAELDAETRCLATAVFYESRSESLDGQLAVAHVVIARARSGRFADTLCGVITQRGQFGFVRNGRLPTPPETSAQWRTSKAIAQIALEGSWENPVEGALFFHATYSSADWDRPMLTKIGRHVFYR